MPCANCGLSRKDHEYNRDGGTGSGKPKHGTKPKGYCEFYKSKEADGS